MGTRLAYDLYHMVLQYPGVRVVYIEDNGINEMLTWVVQLTLQDVCPVQNITGELHHSCWSTIESVNVMSDALLHMIFRVTGHLCEKNSRLNKWLSKLWWGWRFERSSRPLWRNCNELSHLSSYNDNDEKLSLFHFDDKNMFLLPKSFA